MIDSTTNADLVAAERPDPVLLGAPTSAARGSVALDPRARRAATLGFWLAGEVPGLGGLKGITVVVFEPTAL